MATDRQIAANRRNAQKSTGPKTDEGKAASRLNAVRHGFASQNFLLKAEDHDEFAAYRADFIATHQPANATEMFLVDQIVAASWRIPA